MSYFETNSNDIIIEFLSFVAKKAQVTNMTITAIITIVKM